MYQLLSEHRPDGYRLWIVERTVSGLFGKKVNLRTIDNWEEGRQRLNPFTMSILDELDTLNALGSLNDASKLLGFADAAQLGQVDAEALNLPPPFPYQLEVHSSGSLGTETFAVSFSAIDQGVRTPGKFSDGLFTTGDMQYRIAGILFQIIQKASAINVSKNIQEKLVALSELRLLLDHDDAVSKTRTDGFLLRIRIAHVTAFSLKPSVVNGIISFDPVAMRRLDPDDHTQGAELAMAPAAGDLFAREFGQQADVNSTYALQSGQYVYIDPSVRRALRVVKQKQGAPIEERLAFLMSPAKAISEAYKQASVDNDDAPVGETIFFETSQFSERVSGIGEWIPPQLSYLEKNQNNWLPERFSIVLAERIVTGKPEDVPDWIKQVESALAAKKAEVQIGGVTIPTDTPGLLTTLQRIRPPEQVPSGKVPPDEPSATRDRRRIAILVTKSNFDVEEYKKSFSLRRLRDNSIPPMKVELKAHQREGVLWLVNSYVAGWPGVLLADDMGLGKTLQSLTFLTLLRREGVIRKGRPALIVAPTSLLRNWQDEHAKHMLGEGLGAPLVAFGSELRNLKLGHASSDGFQLVDSAQIAANTWVLTTYETVRDYHFSFAQVPFSVAVLDEIQKAKNPTTRLNATLKSLPIEFVLSMTGTPVENSISDLWAITDITAPGYFPPLREFMKKYGKDREVSDRQKALEELSREVLQKSQINLRVVPPYAFRRLKEDVAKDLPQKHEGPMIRRFMPAMQAKRYAELSAATQSKQFSLLRALHDFRSISLHPADPEAVGAGAIQPDEYIEMSARLTEAFRKLADIAIRDEKALIFVNSRRIQNVLARLIAYKFGCPKPEFIRGDTVPSQRQEIVNRFSSLKGFAVLILSPRAAGVGLNIVAANHVIHLDRWWNPAVEDQCTDRAYRIGATKEVFVHTIGAVHPQLGESSYDVILDQLLRRRREMARRIFTSSEITAADFAEVLANRSSQPGASDLLTEIDRAGYLSLEEFVRDIVTLQGLAATLTRSTGDGGADIIVRNELGEITFLIQCKHTNKIEVPIDAGLVQDAKRVRENWQAEDATVIGVTNAKAFAPRVIAEFNKMGGRLIARNELASLRIKLA